MLWNIFCALVRPGTLENHRQENVVVFFPFEYAEFSGYVYFSDFDRKYHFWVNLVQKTKIVSLF